MTSRQEVRDKIDEWLGEDLPVGLDPLTWSSSPEAMAANESAMAKLGAFG